MDPISTKPFCERLAWKSVGYRRGARWVGGSCLRRCDRRAIFKDEDRLVCGVHARRKRTKMKVEIMTKDGAVVKAFPEIKIDSFYKADAMMDSWPTVIISLIGPDEDRMHKRGEHHLLLRFHDTEVENDPEWTAPNREHMVEALAHAKKYVDKGRAKVLVHCTAGKSRSTAVAMGVLVQSGMTAQEALDHVLSIRPVVVPNRLIIRYLDDLLQQDGAMIAVVDEYYDNIPEDGPIPLALLRRDRHRIDP